MSVWRFHGWMAFMIIAWTGVAKAQVPTSSAQPPMPPTTAQDVLLPPPPPPPEGATAITPYRAAPDAAEQADPKSIPVAPMQSSVEQPKPATETHELAKAEFEKKREERDKQIRQKWEWVGGGAVIFAVNYSFMVLTAATGFLVERLPGEPRPNLDALYIPVVGPYIALAEGELRFTDGGPLPYIDGFFQGFGLFSVIYGLALPYPPQSQSTRRPKPNQVVIAPLHHGTGLMITGVW